MGVEPVEAKVQAAIEREGLGGDVLLVAAVSGGPDSMTLLHSLLSLRECTSLRLHVAHVNHNFRGEADEDARFVAAAATALGLPSTVKKADPIAYQKQLNISSFEEAAREVRYNVLAEVSKETGAAAIALGHNADDLAETVLMHIIRGSGIHGLRGMAELSPWRSRDGDVATVLFRPLLGITRRDTEAYCRRHQISFREDPSNLLLRFTRNRVRHELMPILERYNPRVKEALVRLAHSASLEVDYLENEMAEVWPALAQVDGDSVVLNVGALRSLHPHLQRMVLRRSYQQLTGNTRRLEETHLKAMGDFVVATPGKVLGLPRGLWLHAGYGELILGHSLARQCPLPPLEGEHDLPSPSSAAEAITRIPGWTATVRLLPALEAVACDPFIAYLDLEAIGCGLRVRKRIPGDRFRPLGMYTDKKLQNFYVDQKVPRAWRDRIPLLVSDRGIAWVVGYRVAEWARARPDSQRVCEIRFSCGE